jgi:ligand-binding sensor domain-containing protein
MKRIGILLLSCLLHAAATAQNFWQATNGPYGGIVDCFAINSSGYVFAGTWGGGVFLSTNNGTSWTGVNTGLTSTNVLSLAVSSDKYLFAGTFGSGVFRSVRPIVGIKEVEPNNTAGQANQITLGDFVDGGFSVTGDVDYFKVNLSAGDTIDITGSNSAGSTVDGYLRL